MLEHITPVILTFNEIANIARTLDKLSWANLIVVVDSGSNDGTVEFLQSRDKIRLYHRVFTTHAEQWNFAIKETGITSEWILSLDADYVLSDELIAEIDGLVPADTVSACKARFVYCINGKPLRGSLYPPVNVLFRKGKGEYIQDGHTQKLFVSGEVKELQNVVYHDDRKSFKKWLVAQRSYIPLEVKKILGKKWHELTFADRVRKFRVIAPVAVLFYCLIIKGGILDGKAGLYYALQRVTAELLLSINLLKHDLGLMPSDFDH